MRPRCQQCGKFVEIADPESSPEGVAISGDNVTICYFGQRTFCDPCLMEDVRQRSRAKKTQNERWYAIYKRYATMEARLTAFRFQEWAISQEPQTSHRHHAE